MTQPTMEQEEVIEVDYSVLPEARPKVEARPEEVATPWEEATPSEVATPWGEAPRWEKGPTLAVPVTV